MRRARAVVTGAILFLLLVQGVPLGVAAPAKTSTQPVGLALTIIPPKLPADGQSYQAVVVSLIDANHLPSAALQDITVYLTSSLTNIGSVPATVSIQAGSEYAVASLVTTTTPGSATITASSSGLTAASAQVTTVTPSGFPSRFVVFVTPSTLLRRADSGTVRIELVDDAKFPSKAIAPVTVQLSSSNSSIASLDQTSLTFQAGNLYVSGTFHTSGASGQAVFTASSTGFRSGGAVVTVVKPNYCTGQCGPAKIVLKTVPGTLPTDGNSYDSLEVGLATSNGQPAVSSSDTIVQLTSDTPDVVSVPDFVTISAGRISTLASVTTSPLQGKGNLTASSANLLPSTITITTRIPAPSNIQAYIAPPASFVSNAGSVPILVVQLQDSSGNPARARQTTVIVVTPSNSSVVSGPVSLAISAGDDYASKTLTPVGPGTAVLTATSPGLATGKANLQLYPSPLVDSLTGSVPGRGLWTNETLRLTMSVKFLGQPVQNLNVTWTATYGTVAPGLTRTSNAGTTFATFTPTQTGRANITATAVSPRTGPISLHFYANVVQAPPAKVPSLLDVVVGLWYYIVAAVAAVAIAAFYLFRMRRKKQRAEIEAGFEVV